jgi:hypothetical protein
MKTKYSRRSFVAGGMTLAGTTLIGCKDKETADTQTPQNDAPTSDSEKTDADSIKTRKAQCACGQLRATIVGPDPKRISLCPCKLCQRQSGSAFAIQARFPKEQATIEGESKSWRFPVEGAEPVNYTNCAEGGAEFHFCPVCGSTVYYISDLDDSRIGIKVGTFADGTFPPPKITGHIEYIHPWTMDLEGLSLEVVQGKAH